MTTRSILLATASLALLLAVPAPTQAEIIPPSCATSALEPVCVFACAPGDIVSVFAIASVSTVAGSTVVGSAECGSAVASCSASAGPLVIATCRGQAATLTQGVGTCQAASVPGVWGYAICGAS